ncbi:MAG: phenylacetate--CoA ligase family protein [Candidatus Latescibacteria bacterium]|nr:phenylacetate--CoA ligase family protein [Candidatus Latescibacterota bacterium]
MSKTKQDIYLSLPAPIRQGIIYGVSAYNRALRYGRNYRETLELALSADAWTKSEAEAYVSGQLGLLLAEAKAHVAYYTEALAPFSAQHLQEIARRRELGSVPFLAKSTLKARPSSFLNSSRKAAVSSSTSGSTGSPLTVQFDRYSMERRMAFIHHHRRWLGLRPRARTLRLSGREIVPASQSRPPFWVANPFENQLLVSTYHLNTSALPAILDKILSYDPEVIDGYPTAIAQIASAMRTSGGVLGALRGVITTAETLDPTLRAEIESGLGVQVLDYYAASEGVPLIQQCEHGRYHLRLDSGAFEILDENDAPCAPGQPGELVVTSFVQWQMPLIRYRTGDLAISAVANQLCPCGRTLPTIEGVLGRVEDLVLTPDGRKIGMFSYRTLKHVQGYREAQIIQLTESSFRVRYALDGTRPEDEVQRQTQQIFARVLGYESDVEFESVPAIERGPNGKFRSTVGLGTSSPAD